MNSYRTALIWCRAIVINLWANAALGLILGTAVQLIGRNGAFGVSLSSLAESSVLPDSVSVVSLGVLALGVLAPTLAAALTGASPLEGEAILKRRALNKDEAGLARAGAGLILLVFGVAGALTTTALYSYWFLTGQMGIGMGHQVMMQNLAINASSAFGHCAVGLVLAFGPGLRRLMNARAQSHDGFGESQ